MESLSMSIRHVLDEVTDEALLSVAYPYLHQQLEVPHKEDHVQAFRNMLHFIATLAETRQEALAKRIEAIGK